MGTLGLRAAPHGSVLESLVAEETMAHKLVNKGEHDGVDGGDSVKAATWRERQKNAGGQEEEEESSRQQIHPHLS